MDYPLLDMGDTFRSWPRRPCELLSYDGNKYCDVLVAGLVYSVKREYVQPFRGTNKERFKVCPRCGQRNAQRDPHTAQDCKAEQIRTVMDS